MKVLQFKSLEERYADTMAGISKKIYTKIYENAEEFVHVANSIIDDDESHHVYVHINGLERKQVLKYCPNYRMFDTTNSIIMIKITYDEDNNEEGSRVFTIQCKNNLNNICKYEDLDVLMSKLLLSMLNESVYHLNILEVLLKCNSYKKHIIYFISAFMTLDLFSDENARLHFLKIEYAETLEDKIKFFDLGIKELIKKYEE